MNQLSGYYSPSGRVEQEGLTKLMTYGLTGTALCAISAGYLSFILEKYIPFFFIDFVPGILLGLFIGYFLSRGADLGKIRSRKFLMLSGFSLGLIGMYLKAVVFLMALSGHKAVELAPGVLVSALKMLARQRFGQGDASASESILVFFVWGIGAAATVFIPMWRAYRFLDKRPFCENCNEWVDKKESVYPFPMIEKSEIGLLREPLERGYFEVLKTLKLNPLIMNIREKQYTQLDVEYCSGCRQFYLLSISNWETEIRRTQHGEIEVVHTKFFLEHLVIPPKVYKIVRGLDYTEKPMDVDAMIGEVSKSHQFKKKLRKMFLD